MTCSVCLTVPTSTDQIFCCSCGSALTPPESFTSPAGHLLPDTSQLCDTCGQLAPPAARFCGTCGAPLSDLHLGSPGAVEESGEDPDETRSVTVLFADVCGFTGISENLGPEQVKQFVESLFAELGREVRGRGGRIDSYFGDAMLAVFGIPMSKIDDAWRALEASRALHQAAASFEHPALPPGSIRLRIGIDSGPVVVGQVGSIRRTTITGATVTAAMALERICPVGGTLVGRQTAALLPPGIERVVFPSSVSQPVYLVPAAGSGGAPARWEGPYRGPAGQGAAPMGSVREESEEPFGPEGFAAGEGPGPERSLAEEKLLFEALTPPDRRLLQTAAIAGTSFWYELLERLGVPDLDRVLTSLESQGHIRSVRRSRLAGTHEFRFSSERMREVAYDHIIPKVRRFSHQVAAAWLEERANVSLEFVPLMAHHYVQGGDSIAAADVLIVAAQRLSALKVYDEALARYREALSELDAVSGNYAQADRMKQHCREAIHRLTFGLG